MSESATVNTFPNEDLLRAELQRMYRNGRASTAIIDAAIVAHRQSGGSNHPLLDALLDVRSALRAEQSSPARSATNVTSGASSLPPHWEG